MHRPDEIEYALALNAQGLNSLEIAAATGINARTIRDWLAGKTPRYSAINGPGGGCRLCSQPSHDFATPSASYPYLLGLYLGDGCISTHARGVHRLRITLDLKYPNIVAECEHAISALVRGNAVHRQLMRGKGGRYTYVVVSAYSKAWQCWFPQHGEGRKHEREIVLTDWQRGAVDRDPKGLLRGLIHSDGCRFINTGRGNWRCPRYVFSNASADILGIFDGACDLVGIAFSRAPRTVYVSRKADVAYLDTFIGPKS